MWDILDTDFGGDETANFGPRKETGTALYQIDTIATVSCQDQLNTKVPCVSSTVLGDLTSLAVHSSLVLQSTLLLGFDQVIDEIEWSPDGSLIIVGVSEGVLYVVDAQSTESLFSFALVPEDRRVEGKSFKKILFSGTADLVVLTADGQIVVQSGIEVFKQEGADIQSVIKDNIKIVESNQQHIITNDLVLHGNYIFTLGGGDSILAKWNYSGAQIELEDETDSLLENDADLLQGKLTTDDHYLIALDSNNHISVWDTNMFVCVKYWNDMKVKDICLLEQNTSQNNSLEDMKLVVLTTPEDGHCNLKVQSLPGWETVYNLQLNAPSMLAKCNTFQDALYLTEFCSADDQPGTATMVRFRCLNETDPITRLYRILQKNKFEEAEKFAKMYQLDIELVHKVKTNYLVNELSPWNVGKYTPEQVGEMTGQLWVCLDTIADNIHTAESCIRAALPTFAATQSLLSYCKTRLDKVSEIPNKDPTVKDKCHILLTKLLETQHRLITFKMTYGEENFTGEIWEQFMRADMLQESLSWMMRGHLDMGFIIWTRHQVEWTGENQLTSDIIRKVLSSISHHTPATSLQGQLSVGLIPTVVREVPQAMGMVVNFIIEKTENMEQADKSNWPGSAVRFAQFLYTRLQDVTEVAIDQNTCMAQDSANKTRLQYEVVLQPLHTMIIKLQQLGDVLHKYKFRMTLAQFLLETRETIAFRMLDRVVALELITSTLERQVQPYMKEHGLNQDEIFSKYIKDLMERSSQIRSFMESSWEAKAAAIIGFISDLELKIEGILEVMKWAPIPWTQGINDLIQAGLKLKHPRVSRLKEQCDRVHVRKLMLKYGLKNVEVPKGADAEHLMKVMVMQDKPGCMEDALELMKSCNVTNKTEIYTFRLRQLVSTNRIEEAVQLLRSLTPDIGIKVATHLLNYAMIQLDYTVMIAGAEDKINLDKRLFTEAGVHAARYLQGQILDQLVLQDLKLQENKLSHLLALQVKYNIYLTTDQYENEDHKTLVIFTFLKDFLKRLKQSPGLSYAKVYRLADILQISHTKIQGQLAIKSASNGDIQKAVEICGELYESDPSEETAATLFDVAQSFLLLQSNVDADDVDTNKLRLLPELCYKLANQATAICSADKLCEYLELSKTCSLLLDASQQCESGASTLSTEWGEMGDNFDYSTDKEQEMFGAVSLDVFQEDAVMMNSTLVLPLVSQYATSNPLLEWPEEDEKAAIEEESNKIQTVCNRVLPVVQHLRENNHQQLAYLFSVHMLNTLTQYIQQQDMGLPIQSEELCNSLESDKKQVQSLHQTSQSLLKELIAGVVMKIFNCSKIDVNLALTFLCSRPRAEVLEIMMKLTKASGHQYKRLKYVAVMGIALGQLLKEPKLIDNCQVLETDATWGYRLSKMKISFQEVFLQAAKKKHNILPAIAQSDAADCELVKEFCQAYQLDEDEGLLLYLDHLFVPPDDAVYVNTSNRASVLSKAKTTVKQIRRKDELMKRLQKLYYRTSSYDYETLEFILEVMQELDDTEDIPLEKGLKLLGYLKVYTRHSEPSEYELEYKPGGDKKELQIVMSCLPIESKTRLPIHPLLQGDAWKIITPELNRETIATWLLIAKLLCLSDDQVCLTAVQNMVRVYSQTFLSPDAGSDMSQWNWSSDLANLNLLKEVNEVLRLVKNCENSLACAKWMVTKLPMGSEKVLVLKECIRLAELWHQSIPEESAKREKAKAAYLKFLKHWQKMASAQALCQHGLGEAELLQITEKPSVLIQKLYEHPSITDVDWDSVKDKPVIHEAAEAIAQINKVELTSIQNGLIQKWLQSSSHQQAESDTTMTFNLANLKFTEDVVGSNADDEEHNFKRLVHVLKRDKQDEKITLIVEYAFKPSENQDIIGSIRALRCLLHLYNDETLKRLCDKSTEDLRHLMHIMIYLVSLEKLHIKHSVQTFLSCQKEGLIRGIWKNHSHEKTAVTLVSCLCLDYKLYDKQLWASILQRLYQFSLMKQLEYILRRLGNVSELWCIPLFGKMWQAVITAPLNKVCCPLSAEQTDTCVHYFNLLLSCPVLKELDLGALSKSFLRLELSSCAVGCLLMAVTPQEDKIKSLLRGNCVYILDSTSALLANGLDHGIAVKVQEAVYHFVISSECFQDMLGSGHQQNFISYCVRHKSIDSLLQFAAMNQRVSEAKALVDVYISAHTDVLMKLQHYMDYEDDEETEDQFFHLKAYLKMQKLEECVKYL